MDNVEDKKKSFNGRTVILIGTAALCILLIVLVFWVLNYSQVGSVCERLDSSNFDCGGATVAQFNYESGPLHGDIMAVLFLLIYSICIGEIVSLISIVKNKALNFEIAFFFIISTLMVCIGTTFLIDDIHYGNEPHLKENQVLMDN